MVLPDLNFSPPEESDIPEEGIPEVNQNAGTLQSHYDYSLFYFQPTIL
jgi:hypothetical protein